MDDFDLLNIGDSDPDIQIDGEVSIENESFYRDLFGSDFIDNAEAYSPLDMEDEESEYSIADLYSSGARDVLSEIESILRVVSAFDLTINKRKVMESEKFEIPASQMPYLPERVRVPLNNILADLSEPSVYEEQSDDQRIEHVLTTLKNVCLYTPTGHKSDFVSNVLRYVKRFYIMQCSDTSSDYLSDYVDVSNLNRTIGILKLNSQFFSAVSSLLEETDTRMLTINLFPLRDKMDAALIKSSGGNITYGDVRDTILALTGEPKLAKALSLSIDELKTMSSTEVLRRLLMFETKSGDYNPSACEIVVTDLQRLTDTVIELSHKNSSSLFGNILNRVCLLSLATLLKSTTSENEKLRKIQLIDNLFSGFYRYNDALVNSPSLINIEFYHCVKRNCDGKLSLKYIHEGEVHEVDSDGLLCSIVGMPNSSHTVVESIECNNLVLLPPKEIISSVTASRSGAFLHSPYSDTKFIMKPTVEWASANDILVEDEKNDYNTSKKGTTPSYATDQLVRALVDCSYPFVDLNIGCSPGYIEYDGYRIYVSASTSTFDSGDNQKNNFNIFAVFDSFNSLVSQNGHLVYDHENSEYLGEFTDISGEVVSIQLKDSELDEVYLGSDEENEEEFQDFLKFLPEALEINADEVEPTTFRKYVMDMCDAFSMNYNKLLKNAQNQIYSSLYYILKLDTLRKVVYRRLYETYLDMIKDKDFMQVGSNFSNLSNAKAIVRALDATEKSKFLSAEYWDESTISQFEDACSLPKASLTNYCKYLDSLDYSILAIVSDKKSTVVRDDYKMDYYAMLCIPGIRERFQLLEDYIILMTFVVDCGSKVHTAMSKTLLQMRDVALSADRIDEVDRALAKSIVKNRKIPKSELKIPAVLPPIGSIRREMLDHLADREGRKTIMAMTKKYLLSDSMRIDSMIKHFIIQQDSIGLIDALKDYVSRCPSTEYEDLLVKCQKLVEDGGNSLMFRSLHDTLSKFFIRGLLYDSSTYFGLHTIRDFDLMRCEFIFSGDNRLSLTTQQVDRKPLKDFVASMFISYCPMYVGDVEGSAMVNGRDVLFATDSDQFYMPLAVSDLAGLSVTDLCMGYNGEVSE